MRKKYEICKISNHAQSCIIFYSSLMTKAEIKYIQALAQQKYRKEHNAYLVEGDKNAEEWLKSTKNIKYVVATQNWLQKNVSLLSGQQHIILEALPHEIEKISTLKTPTEVVLVVNKDEAKSSIHIEDDTWYLALDAIRDPGNMGTIIRIADWFGIKTIFCSEDCVEIWSPKVVQASMGSLLRVNVVTTPLSNLLESTAVPIYITHLQGDDFTQIKKPKPGILLMGNESKGVNDALILESAHKVLIPRIGAAESLNVAVATGIVCSKFILP